MMTWAAVIASRAASVELLPVSDWASSVRARSLSRIQFRHSRSCRARPSGPRSSHAGWADRRRAALQASGVDLALPQVRAGREPTVRNTRGGESLNPVHFGVDDATAAAIGKGARELSARRRGSKGAAAAEAGAWNSKFLARYGLDKTLR